MILTPKMRRALSKKLRAGIDADLAKNPTPFVRVKLRETLKGRVMTYRKGKIMRGRLLEGGWELVPIPTPEHMIGVMCAVPTSAIQIL